MLISTSLALAALTDACTIVDEDRAKLSTDLGSRDDLIRDAHESKVAERKIIEVTGLSRSAIRKIIDRPNSKEKL